MKHSSRNLPSEGTRRMLICRANAAIFAASYIILSYLMIIEKVRIEFLIVCHINLVIEPKENRRYMTGILPIRSKTQSINQSIEQEALNKLKSQEPHG